MNPAQAQIKGGDQAAEEEKKRSENAAVVGLPRRLLPAHLRRLHPRLRLHLRLLPHAHHIHPATVGVAALAAAIPAVNPESSLRKGKKRSNIKRKGKRRRSINVKRTRKLKEEKKILDLFRSQST